MRPKSELTRRDFFKTLGFGAGAALFGACVPHADDLESAPQVTPTHTPFQPSPPTLAPAATAAPSPSVTPEPRKLCFVLWDHQLARYNYRPRNLADPVPMTCPLYSGAINLMTREWLEYWQGILHVCNPTVTGHRFESAFDGLVADNRAFTNDTSPASGLFAVHSLTCGGATHEMVTGIPEGEYMRIYTLNSRKPPPPIPSSPDEIDITRHFFATTGSNIRLADGSYAVYGFPQFDNCIIPLLSPEDTDLVLTSRIKVVTEVQRPYNT
jgi:hypothetical protein